MKIYKNTTVIAPPMVSPISWTLSIDLYKGIHKYHIYLSYLPNPSARAGYDTSSIFKRSLTGFNWEFSF